MTIRKAKAPVSGEERGLTADELPVTRRMLVEVRGELLSRIDRTRDELKAEIHGVKAEIHGMKAEIHDVKAEIHDVKAEFHGVKADVATIKFLVEEQNARNKVVFDALLAFMDRQTRVEQRMDAVEATVRDLAASRPPGRPESG